MTLVDTPTCTVCPETDNLQHFFYLCEYVNNFWKNLFDWLNNSLNFHLAMNEEKILFGIDEENDRTFVVNYIILHAKFFIYNNRVNNNHTLSLFSFKCQLKQKLEIEKIITIKQHPE